MARKSKDLFELLRARAGGAPVEPAPARPQVSEVVETIRERVGRMLGRTPKPEPKPRKTAAAPRTRKTAARTQAEHATWWSDVGPLLALVGFGCLALGFVIGRMTASGEGGQELRMPAGDDGKPRVFPQMPVGGGAGIELSAEAEEGEVSKFFFAVISYGASQREQASRLALHLRENQVPDARIQRHILASGQARWFVFVYVRAADRTEALQRSSTVLERLRAVPNPEFEPSLRATVAKLTPRNLLTPGGAERGGARRAARRATPGLRPGPWRLF